MVTLTLNAGADDRSMKPQAPSPPIQERPQIQAPPPKSPVFRKATAEKAKAKILLYGGHGTRKTRTALQMPKPVVIDLEGGAELYAGEFDFDIAEAKTVDDVERIIEELVRDNHGYETVVLDSLSILWDMIMRKWSEIFMVRKQKSKGFKFEYYDMQPGDWATPKDNYKYILESLVNTGLNVVCTARQKKLYSDTSFMVPVGMQPDCEKSTPHFFDTILRCEANGEYPEAVCEKDRSGALINTGKINLTTADALLGAFSKQLSTKKKKGKVMASEETQMQIIKYFQSLELSPKQISSGLSRFNANAVEDLTEDDAKTLLSMLQSMIGQKGK